MDSQFKQPVKYTCTRGIWSDDPLNGLRVPDNYCSAASGFHFFNDGAISRSGLIKYQLPTDKGSFIFGKHMLRQDLPLGAGSSSWSYGSLTERAMVFGQEKYFDLIYSPSTIAGTLTEILPTNGTDTFLLASLSDSSIAYCLQDLLIGGNKGGVGTKLGIHKIASTWSAFPDADSWYHLVGHLSRLFVAFKNSGSNGEFKVGWTVSGTNDDFTNFGSGEVTLTDSYDFVCGLFVIRNQVVIARNGGFTLANLTGQADPAYTLETFTKESQISPKYYTTIASDGLVCFFVGDDDVYTFNLSQITPIGQPIAKQLLDNIALVPYRGVVLRSAGRDRRRVYCLSPMEGTSPVYVYDIKSQTWTTLHFDEAIFGGIWDLGTESVSADHPFAWMPAFLDTEKGLNIMLKTVDVEKAPTITFGPSQVGDIKNDYRPMNNYLSVFVEGPGGLIQLDVTCRRGVNNDLVQSSYIEPAIPQVNGEPPQRVVFKLDQVGQYFIYKFTFPAGNTIRFDEFDVEYAHAGELR